jgi:hypothetical protein
LKNLLLAGGVLIVIALGELAIVTSRWIAATLVAVLPDQLNRGGFPFLANPPQPAESTRYLGPRRLPRFSPAVSNVGRIGSCPYCSGDVATNTRILFVGGPVDRIELHAPRSSARLAQADPSRTGTASSRRVPIGVGCQTGCRRGVQDLFGGGQGFAALFSACFLCQVKAKSGGRTATTVAAQRAKMGR